MKNSIFPFLLTCGIALTACGTTQFKSTWRDRQFAFLGLSKALVVGVVQKKENQKLLEDEFSKCLAYRGVEAITSYSLAPQGSEIPEDAWKRMIADQHIEVIIISRLVDIEGNEKEAFPKGETQGSYACYHRCVEIVQRPKETTRWKYATIETRVYRTSTDSVVWTGDSRTRLDPGFKVEVLVRDFAQTAVNAMYAQ